MAKPKHNYEYIPSKGLYRIRILDVTGKLVALTAKTPEKLEEKIAEFRRREKLSETGKKNMLVCDYLDLWLELHGAGLGHNTVEVNYKYIINHNIKPKMEGKRMLDVRPDDILEVMAALNDKSESIFNGTYKIINQVFKAALDNHDILDNPCPPKPEGGIEPGERSALTERQCQILIEAVKDLHVYPFCMIALYSGLRREEILALQWDCVDLGDTPHIEVKRALRFEHNRPVVSDKLKTKSAKRTIPIPDVLADCLRGEKEKSTSEYVIANSKGGPLSGSQFKSLWNAVIVRTTRKRTYKTWDHGKIRTGTIEPKLGEKARHQKHYYTIDFDVTPLLLRHTYITNLLIAGIDIKTVQYLAGHKRSRITLDIYAHFVYNRPEELIGKVRNAFGNTPDSEEEESDGNLEETQKVKV